MGRHVRQLGAIVAAGLLAVSSGAMAQMPSWTLTDLEESGRLPKLYRAPDDRLHLLYVTDDGFRWRIWNGDEFRDQGLIPESAGQVRSKFNAPSIVALGDGTFHVLWGPTADFGLSHDVFLQSHDGASWSPRRIIRPEYTEYLHLAPMPGGQLAVIGVNVCLGSCPPITDVAFTSAVPDEPFPDWTALMATGREQKTPFVFVEPATGVFHLITRLARASFWRNQNGVFDAPVELFADAPYSVALPTVSALAGGHPVVSGVEWDRTGGWHADHVRLVAHDGSSWTAGGEGERLDSASQSQNGISFDAAGGVHVFYVATAGELSYQYSDGATRYGPALMATGVAFHGIETDNLATAYTDQHVHVIVPVSGSLHHVLIDAGRPAEDPDAGADAGQPDAAVDAGSGGSGGDGGSPSGSPPSTTGASADPNGCGCRLAPSKPLPLLAPGTMFCLVVLLRRRRSLAAT